MRELSLPLIVRLWDTYFSEEKGFAGFHVFVCAAFLLTFAPNLKACLRPRLCTFLAMFDCCYPNRTWIWSISCRRFRTIRHRRGRRQT